MLFDTRILQTLILANYLSQHTENKTVFAFTYGKIIYTVKLMNSALLYTHTKRARKSVILCDTENFLSISKLVCAIPKSLLLTFHKEEPISDLQMNKHKSIHLKTLHVRRCAILVV